MMVLVLYIIRCFVCTCISNHNTRLHLYLIIHDKVAVCFKIVLDNKVHSPINRQHKTKAHSYCNGFSLSNA